MAKTKFVPGPFTYDGEYVWLGNSEDGKMLAEIRGCGWLQYGKYSEMLDEVIDANGNLFAAAPDLYTELEKLVELLGHTDIAAKNGIPLLPAIAALMKARGEKS